MTVKKATKKTPAKKASTRKPTEYWAWAFKGDGEMYEIYSSYDKMMVAIKDTISSDYYYVDKSKPVEVRIFKMEKEMKFQVTVEEVPATTKKITVKEAA